MGGCELFQQELKQHPIFTQTMLQNLSVLQMNRTALNIYVYEVTKNNPLVKSTKNFVPWNSTISPVSPDIIEQTLIQEQKLFDKIKEELILEIEESDSPILYLILGNLNAQGFLQIPLEQLFVNTTYDFEHVQKIHTYIMKSSLMGLGAKDSKEYLLFITKEQYGDCEFQHCPGRSNLGNAVMIDDEFISCPKCKGIMIERTNSNSKEKFFGCSNYTNGSCKNTMQLKSDYKTLNQDSNNYIKESPAID
jgi:hypothetical protein